MPALGFDKGYMPGKNSGIASLYREFLDGDQLPVVTTVTELNPLEDAFWEGLKEIARARSITLSDLVAAIDSERRHGNLSSAIRLFVLDFYRNQLADVKEGRDDVEGQLAMKVEEPERLRLL